MGHPRYMPSVGNHVPGSGRQQVGRWLPDPVWNSVVFDTVNGGDQFVSMIEKATAVMPSGRQLLDQLIRRKKEAFGEDLRLIGEYKVTYENGDLHVWAEARIPPTDQ